jgi:hypothetical protein
VLLLGVWFLAQAVLGLEGLTGSVGREGVAYLALVASFVFGLLSIRLLVRTRAPGLPPAVA